MVDENRSWINNLCLLTGPICAKNHKILWINSFNSTNKMYKVVSSLCSLRTLWCAAPPVLGEVSPTFLIQQEGDTVDMFCEATAAPSPSLTWRKDGHELLPSTDDRVRVYGNRVQLRRLQRTDGGAYSCTFSNVVGRVSHVIKLVVEGRAASLSSRRRSYTHTETETKQYCFEWEKCHLQRWDQ